MRRSLPVAIPAALLTLLAASARGQQPQKLTLAGALELAERQNLELVAARERRAVALAGVQVARERPNPTANFSASRDTPHEGLFLDQPLEIGPKRKRRIEVARQQGKLTDVDISILERRVRRSAREAYYDVAFARASSNQRAQALELARRLEQIARERFEAGDVPRLEVIAASLEVSRAETELRVAQQEEKVALSRLNTLLNEPAETSWDLAGSLEDVPQPLLLPDLVQRAQGSNPELQRLAQEQTVEQSRTAWLRADRLPNLSLQFGADFNSPHDFQVGGRGGLSLTLPLFSRNQGEIAQSLANQRVLSDEARATRRIVAAQVEEAYLGLASRQTKVELYRQTLLSTARQLESMAEESYRAGKANLLTVLDAQRNVQQVEREYLDGLLALQEAFATLEETVGAPLD